MKSRHMLRSMLILIAVTIALAVPCGCQNELAITVEKLEGVTGRAADSTDAGALLAAMRDLLSGLDAICTECRIASSDSPPSAALLAVTAAQQSARALRPTAESLAARRARGETGRAAFAGQVDALRRQVMRRVPLSAAVFNEILEGEADPARRAELADAAARWTDCLERFTAQADALDVGRAGFGGFRQAGVYRINPGDANYDAVLRARPLGNPLTSVRVRATGDSGIMVVQESPGQMRLYQLTSDPLAIMRNASFILDKVLQAAVKFGAEAGG